MDIRKARDLIMLLSGMCDLIALRVQVIEKSKYGKRPHRSDPWGYTRAFLAYYAPETAPEGVIALFEEAGCKDEIAAVRWLLKHDELVP